jgi:hypothetical protein
MSRTGNILSALFTGLLAGRLFHWWQPSLTGLAWGIAIATAIVFYLALTNEPETR